MLKKQCLVVLILSASAFTTSCVATAGSEWTAQPEPRPTGIPSARLVLVGDAGLPLPEDTNSCGAEPTTAADVAASVRNVFAQICLASRQLPDRTIVVWLGDNVYETGFPSRNELSKPGNPALRADCVQARTLERQLTVGREARVKSLFIPGNHDWNQSKPDGVERLRAEEEYLEMQPFGTGARFLPPDGCPGPISWDVKGVRVVAMDTEWLLKHSWDDKQKAGSGLARCRWGSSDSAEPYGENAGPRDVLASLDRVLAESAIPVIVVAHHPVITHGEHGGYLPAAWWIVPIYPAVRYAFFASLVEDIFGSNYWRLRSGLRAVLARNRGHVMAFASGHEHTLQILQTSGLPLLLVSGAGSKHGSVGKSGDTIFKAGHLGFLIVDVFPDRSAYIEVVDSENAGRPAGRTVTPPAH